MDTKQRKQFSWVKCPVQDFRCPSLLRPFLHLLCYCCFPLIMSQLFQMRLFLFHVPHPVWHVHARLVHKVCYPCQLPCTMKLMRDTPSDSGKCAVYSETFCQITSPLIRLHLMYTESWQFEEPFYSDEQQ